MKEIIYILIILLLVNMTSSCHKSPDNVIPPQQMAELLADIHRGEGAVDMNRKEWRTDSLKMALREAIYLKHGVNQELVDTSLDWYGHHIEQYMEVYASVIDLLQEEIDRTDAVAARIQMAVAGDSADIWSNSTRYMMTENTPEPVLSFLFAADENWEKGDVYTWNLKLFNAKTVPSWMIAVEYDDGEIEWRKEDITENGRASLTLISDSTKLMKKVFGVLNILPTFTETVFIDSISLLRTRVNRQTYSRRFTQKKIRTIPSGMFDVKEKEDTLVNNDIITTDILNDSGRETTN